MRAAVVDQLVGKLGRDAIIAMFAPKAEARVSRSQHCPVCDRFTRHRRGECEEHEVKYCDKCDKMTAHTSNGKCSLAHLHITQRRTTSLFGWW